MKEHPILFNGPMVRALLDGSKTQTRRIMKPQPEPTPADYPGPAGHWWPSNIVQSMVHVEQELQNKHGSWGGFCPDVCPHGRIGDRLWVRETCRAGEAEDGVDGVRYIADDFFRAIKKTPTAEIEWLKLHTYRSYNKGVCGPKVPAIHMPRWASRILLEIVSVRVERLQDISDADARAEGIHQCDGLGKVEAILDLAKRMGTRATPSALHYATLWESINGAGSWDANPWVWVVEFRRVAP